VALVTGAGGHLGGAIAHALAAGHVLALGDLDDAACAATAARLRMAGAEAVAHGVDVTDAEAVASLIAQIEHDLGPVDVLVNNAGIVSTAPIEELTLAEWQRVISVDLTGYYVCTRAVIVGMIARRRGAVVNVSSVAGKRGGGFLGTSAYAAAKAGVLGFTKAVAREVAPHGVRSNAVAPGPLEGGMTAGISPAARERLLAHVPLARLGRPEEVAAAVAFLAGDAAAWITGETINVDGGILME